MFSKLLARWLFSLGLAGLGLLSLIYDDFALVWQPVPEGVPARALLAYASGLLLLAGGVGMLVERFAVRAGAVTAWFLASWLVLLRVPQVVKAPGDAGVWLGFGETLLLVAGAWTWFALLKRRAIATSGGECGWWASDRGLVAARLLFGVALPLIGWSHFVYADATAGMVPAWLPLRKGFAYLTGAGHIAAGVALLTGILPRLAATAEAAMIGCFVVLLHAPGVAAAPRDRMQWTMLCVAMAMDGAAWAVAASFEKAPRRDA